MLAPRRRVESLPSLCRCRQRIICQSALRFFIAFSSFLTGKHVSQVLGLSDSAAAFASPRSSTLAFLACNEDAVRGAIAAALSANFHGYTGDLTLLVVTELVPEESVALFVEVRLVLAHAGLTPSPALGSCHQPCHHGICSQPQGLSLF
jgi:hypothetical protein